MNNKHKAQIDQNPFFLPNLCNARAVLFLVLVAELLALVIELADFGLLEFSWQSFALTSLFLQWTMLLSAACLCGLRPYISHWRWPLAAALSYLTILLIVVITSLLAQGLLGEMSFSRFSINVDGLVSNVLIAAVLAGIALRYFYLTEQLRLREQAVLQSRIEALQARIRPHFLFNSMNTIASLIAVDPPAAETAVEDLSSLFRASLAESRAEVTIADELDVCRCYARIEQARLGKRLKLDWRVDDNALALPIPALCLQPLLENAIYHGIQQLPEGGRVTIEVVRENQQVLLTVTNPLSQEKTETDGHQIAQQNIHHRLQALYGPDAGLKTAQSANEHRAIIHYPVSEGTA
jgi:two-component system sensor histidine kinase AlgZ